MSKQEKENVKTDVKTFTAKESGATAIYHVVKADLIHSGATEEIAELGAMKAMCAFETAWSMSVDKACEWLVSHLGAPEGMPQAKSYNDAMKELITEFRKGMNNG